MKGKYEKCYIFLQNNIDRSKFDPISTNFYSSILNINSKFLKHFIGFLPPGFLTPMSLSTNFSKIDRKSIDKYYLSKRFCGPARPQRGAYHSALLLKEAKLPQYKN